MPTSPPKSTLAADKAARKSARVKRAADLVDLRDRCNNPTKSEVMGHEVAKLTSADRFVWTKEQLKIFQAFADEYPTMAERKEEIAKLVSDLDMDIYAGMKNHKVESVSEIVDKKMESKALKMVTTLGDNDDMGSKVTNGIRKSSRIESIKKVKDLEKLVEAAMNEMKKGSRDEVTKVTRSGRLHIGRKEREPKAKCSGKKVKEAASSGKEERKRAEKQISEIVDLVAVLSEFVEVKRKLLEEDDAEENSDEDDDAEE